MAVNELQQFVRATSSSSSSPGSSSSSNSHHSAADCAVIICGDFNSPPHTLPYQLLSRARIDDVMLDKLRRTCQFHDQVSNNLSFNSLVLSIVLRRRLLICCHVTCTYRWRDCERTDWWMFCHELRLPSTLLSTVPTCPSW